jgi:A/G-specific adenine glycosylase
VLGGARKLRAFRTRLLAWYDGNKRDLPWRVTKDAYRVCISEIMLQQTRVAVVKQYYPRFLVKFPTVRDLARARLASVLAAWSGLGYYRRARALHAAAKVLVAKHGGRFPQTADELQSLPGVGRYTAAAIASIAFDEPTPVVDGNVERVITRLLAHNYESRQLWKAAGEILDTTRPGDFNQAMMELGATVCLPRQPLCQSCPVFGWCAGRGEFGDRPVEKRKKAILRYCLATDKDAVFLVQRPAGASLMAGMWELPEIAPGAGFPSNRNGGFKLRHSITITDYTVEVLHGEPPEGSNGRWIPRSRVSAMPLTGLTRKIFRRSNII